jgi:hypothetical protein
LSTEGPYPSRFVGVDFSGAKQAGRSIWLTEGMARINAAGHRVLEIHRGESAAELPGGGTGRDLALRALRTHIIKAKEKISTTSLTTAYGIDFPFTLPRVLLEGRSWEEFIASFADRFPNPEQFRNWCRRRDSGSERKRKTEKKANVPFASYNLRLYRQTYYGIREILAPLVRNHQVWVLPMQQPDLQRPWLMETCPASALKRLNLYGPYKGKTANRRRHRQKILAALLKREDLTLPKRVWEHGAFQSRFIDNAGGDALDSLIAAAIAFWHAPDPSPDAIDDLDEGYVYD